MDQARAIGDRVRDIRKRRGLTQRDLAGLSGMSLSLVRKLEQGERQDIRIETARKLAVSLGVPTMALIGDAPEPSPVTGQPAWEPVRQALISPAGGSAFEPVTEEGLSGALTAAVKLYHDNEYSSLALVLPGLLRDARDASPLLRSRVLQLTGSLMVQTRQRDIARIALDRSLADAEESGSVLDAASSVITMCWLLLLEKQFEQVRTMALQWADRIEPKFSIATPAELSTWGWLLLRASAAAIRDNRPGEAAHAMRLAQAAAVTVGRDRGSYHSYWTTFGPATLAMKQVENSVIDGKPDIALALADKVPRNLRPTSDNRNRHLLDVTAAHVDLRQYPEAFDVLFRLYQEVPAWLENQHMAKDLLDKIVTRRRSLTADMRELADFLSLAI
jgi:transcriptional regulator with XRE-family HTH domain